MGQKRELVAEINDVVMDLPNLERFLAEWLTPLPDEDMAKGESWKGKKVAPGEWQIDWEIDVATLPLGYVTVLQVGDKLSLRFWRMEWDVPQEGFQIVDADSTIWESLDTTKTYRMWANVAVKRVRDGLQRVGALPSDEPPPTRDSTGYREAQLSALQQDTTSGQAGQEPPTGGSYHIHIERASSLAIGDGAQVIQAAGKRSAPAGAGAKDASDVANLDQRCADLAEHMRETLELVKGYEEQRRLADDPKAKRRAELEIADLRRQLAEYQAEARELGCD